MSNWIPWVFNTRYQNYIKTMLNSIDLLKLCQIHYEVSKTVLNSIPRYSIWCIKTMLNSIDLLKLCQIHHEVSKTVSNWIPTLFNLRCPNIIIWNPHFIRFNTVSIETLSHETQIWSGLITSIETLSNSIQSTTALSYPIKLFPNPIQSIEILVQELPLYTKKLPMYKELIL